MRDDLNDVGGAKELARHRLNISKEDLDAAKRNFREKDLRTANNRAYYAIYHAICACMALRFEAYKSHAQTLGAFNRDYVHTGDFPKEIGRRIAHCEEIRHESDYNDFYVVSRTDTEEQIQTADEFIRLAEEYILHHQKDS